MTQILPEREPEYISAMQGKEAPQPLDLHLAEGIAIHGLFCAVQKQLVHERLSDAFTYVREDLKPTKHRSLTIARTIGDLSLPGEDMIDDFINESARAQNHGTVSAQLESNEIGDIIWKGYDPNSVRFLTLFKRTRQTIMTDGSLPILTMWELKAHPKA